MKSPGTLRIGRVRGIDLNIHISLLFLLIYLTFVTAARFNLIVAGSGVKPDALSFGPTGWSLILAGGLFVSILLHELGHSFMAQAHGVKVKNVTLMMLGGVSQMEKMPEKNWAEFKVAVIGPLVSFAIAGLMYLAWQTLSNPNLVFFSYWIASLNLVLGVFNMFPAFPMDGGRALRSVLAVKQGKVKATQNAVRLSRVFAWAFGLWGLFTFNVVLMVIAFFIYTAAQAELFFLLTKGILKGISAGDVGTRVPVLRGGHTLDQAVHLMIENKAAALPVNTGTHPASMIALPMIQKVSRERWKSTRVSELMLQAPLSLDVNDPIGESIAELATAPGSTLPLTDDGELIGYVSYAEVTELLQFKSLKDAEEKYAHQDDIDRAA